AARDGWRKAHPEAKRSEGLGPYPFRTVVVARRYRATDVPQRMQLKFADGSEQRFEWPPGEKWHRWELTTPSRCESAQLDPEGRWYADTAKLDDGRTIERNRLAPRRWTLEAAAWVQMALAMLEAL